MRLHEEQVRVVGVHVVPVPSGSEGDVRTGESAGVPEPSGDLGVSSGDATERHSVPPVFSWADGPPTELDARQDILFAQERARRSGLARGPLLESGIDIDRIWRGYKQIWALAEETCGVFLVESIENNYSGAYFGNQDQKDRQIHIRRNALGLEALRGYDHPVWCADLVTLAHELCTIAHELAHAEHHIIGDLRYHDYRRALSAWVEHDENGGVFTDWDRGRIYEEESLAEIRGREIVQIIIPEIVQHCDQRIYENLNAYHSILWTGKYPSGKIHKWDRKLYLNPLQANRSPLWVPPGVRE